MQRPFSRQFFRCPGYWVLTLMQLVGCASETASPIPEQTVSVPAVRTVAVTQSEIQRTTTQPATVHAWHQAGIRSRASGYVKELKVDIGDMVTTDDVLAVIDVPDLQKQSEIIAARIVRLQAEERRSEAEVELAAARVRSSQARLAESRSQLDQAAASLAAAEAEFGRTQDLVQRGSLQNRVLDEVRMKRDSEKATIQAVKSAIESAGAEVAVAEAQKNSAEADLMAAQADTLIAERQLEELEILIAWSQIKAPFAGIVTARSVEPGNLVSSHNRTDQDKPLFVISRIDRLRIRIPVPEADAPYINTGDPIQLQFPSFPAEPPRMATVSRRSGSLDPNSRTMVVEADIENSDGRLLPGMFGQATITAATNTTAQLLPAQAVRFDETGQAYVYVVSSDQTVTVADVTIGADNGLSIQVLSGVEPGQRVIGPHLKRFTDGQKVSVLPN